MDYPSARTKQNGHCREVSIVLYVAISVGLTVYEIESVNMNSYLPKIALLRG